MSQPPPTLQEFAQWVPVCHTTASLEKLFDLFESQAQNMIVALNESCAPLGLLHLRQLLPYLTGHLATVGARSHHPSESRSILDITTILEPVPVLPSSLTIEEWRFQLGRNQGQLLSPYYALVGPTGEYQGMLALERILGLTLGQFPQTKAPTAQLPILLQAIEAWPVPLALQREDGTLQQKNCAWREQIGEINTFEEGHFTPESLNSEPLILSPLSQQWCDLMSKEACFSLASQTITTEIGRDCASRTAEGNRAWQFVKLPLTSFDSAPLWLIMATDVTEQRQLCKELAAKNADLVQLNRLKDEFLACVSHELKTPLTAVLGLSSLLKDNKLGELNPRQARYSQLIYQSGRQLMAVVNDILDLTRLETGQLKLNLEPVNVKNVCERAYQQARQQLAQAESTNPDPEPETPIDFSLEIAPDLETIVADELRLRQMLAHLLHNALKFTQTPAGALGLKVNRWQGWIDFTVWDTGIGIPETAQHLIFQKFQQLESPLTRQFEGTGLGLVLTQRLARAHGGDISFISKVGQGSQFTLLLPPTPRPNSLTEGKSLMTPERLVLIVEAVPQYIERLTQQLHKTGYRVLIARSGTEALEKARQIQPQAIFLNPLLPLLSGWDVLTLLKADSKTQHIPVFITATRAEKGQAQQNGADGFLSLPIQKQDLNEALIRLRANSRFKNNILTILHLHASPIGKGAKDRQEEKEEESSLIADFSSALGQSDLKVTYRVLEADDLEQGNLLARVWKPDVMLLDGSKLNHPVQYLRSLQHHKFLAALPIVTLDPKTTAAANQVENLVIFPCLIPLKPENFAALFHALRVAAGHIVQPNILAISCQKNDLNPATSSSALTATTNEPQEFVTLIHYLQTAGFNTRLSASWSEIYGYLNNDRIDLLAIDLSSFPPEPEWLLGLRQLQQLPFKPPILVLDRRPNPTATEGDNLDNFLTNIALEVIPYHSQSFHELLTRINALLNEH